MEVMCKERLVLFLGRNKLIHKILKIAIKRLPIGLVELCLTYKNMLANALELFRSMTLI